MKTKTCYLHFAKNDLEKKLKHSIYFFDAEYLRKGSATKDEIDGFFVFVVHIKMVGKKML